MNDTPISENPAITKQPWVRPILVELTHTTEDVQFGPGAGTDGPFNTTTS